MAQETGNEIADRLHDMNPGEEITGAYRILSVEYTYTAKRRDEEKERMFGLYTTRDTSIVFNIDGFNDPLELPAPVERIEDGPAGRPVRWEGEGPVNLVAASVRQHMFNAHKGMAVKLREEE